MSGRGFSAEAAAAIQGEAIADQALTTVRQGHADPEALLRAITRAGAEDGQRIGLTPALRGMARRIQKALEGCHA